LATPVATYAFINAKLRGRISKLLDEQFFRGIARARTFVEAIGQLAGTEYEQAGQVYNQTGDVKLCELELVRIEREALGQLDRYIPDAIRPFTDAVLRQYEVATLKHALRLWFERTVRGRSVDDKVAYLLRDGQVTFNVDGVINADNAEGIRAALEDTLYDAVIAGHLERLETEQSLFSLEVHLDQWYFAHLRERAAALGRRDAEVAGRLIGIQIDLQNVDWLVRMKHYYKLDTEQFRGSILQGGTLIPAEELDAAYGAEQPVEPLVAALGARFASLAVRRAPEGEHRQVQRLALLEDLLRSVLFHEIRRTLGGYPFTIGTLLAYFLLAQNEVRTLVSVLNGKYYDLDVERIEGLI
jgi:V/A-type H+-transporting ATPase subunit C